MANTVIRLIHWNAGEAEQKAKKLQSAGYDVIWQPPNQDGYKAFQKENFASVVIDLTRLPSHGREVANFLRQKKSTRHIPIIFVEGDPEKVEGIRKLLPDAIYTTWNRIRGVVKKALANPPNDLVVPVSHMAGYSGTPLPKKLGIKENCVVCLVGAPRDFEKTLGELPAGVKLKRQARGPCDLVVWFTKSAKDLNDRVVPMGKLAESGSLWIAWPKKASGVKTDVSESLVRNTGLASGLVDFKICAIDATWSGLRFTRRKHSD